MKKYFYSIFSILLFANFSFAFSQLPKNSYLQFNDNNKAVLILQQILNSDPETQIASDGIGSPGNENWYFGRLTETALRKFQEKNSLEITGKIDVKTLQKLNSKSPQPVSALSVPSSLNKEGAVQSTSNDSKTQPNPISGDDNIYLSGSSSNKYSNPYFLDTSTADTKNYQNSPASTLPNTAPKPKTYLDSIIDKYTNLFAPSNSQNVNPNPNTNQNNSQNLNSTNPYLNNQPNANSNSANPFLPQSSNPYATQPISPFGGGASPFGGGPLGSMMNGLTRTMNGGNPAGAEQPYVGQTGGTVGQGNYNGATGQQPGRPNTIFESDGWVKGSASDFGCNDTYATNHFGGGNNGNGNKTSMQAYSKEGWIKINQDCKLFLISVPLSIQKYFFGNSSLSQLYAKAAGSPVEVVNLNNKNCTVVPIWDTGPGDTGKETKFVIDLTIPVKLVLGAKKGDNFPARYRPVKSGQKGCEGYNFVDGNNKGLHIPERK